MVNIKEMSEKERKFEILHALIREYVDTAEPVGSEALCKKGRLAWSSATVRNDLAELEIEGYLTKPHTSGGRIPTDKAYRNYVNNLLAERQDLEKRFSGKMKPATEEIQKMETPEEMVHAAAKLLARFTQHLIFGGIIDRRAIFGTGLAELVGEPEFEDSENVVPVARFVEDFTDNVFAVTKKLLKDDLQLYIGGENPVSEIRSCSLILSDFHFPSGERGFFAILGPTRMHYERNIGLLQNFVEVVSEE